MHSCTAAQLHTAHYQFVLKFVEKKKKSERMHRPQWNAVSRNNINNNNDRERELLSANEWLNDETLNCQMENLVLNNKWVERLWIAIAVRSFTMWHEKKKNTFFRLPTQIFVVYHVIQVYFSRIFNFLSAMPFQHLTLQDLITEFKAELITLRNLVNVVRINYKKTWSGR